MPFYQTDLDGFKSDLCPPLIQPITANCNELAHAIFHWYAFRHADPPCFSFFWVSDFNMKTQVTFFFSFKINIFCEWSCSFGENHQRKGLLDVVVITTPTGIDCKVLVPLLWIHRCDVTWWKPLHIKVSQTQKETSCLLFRLGDVIRVFHEHTKLSMLALLSIFYSHLFFAVFFFICTNWC